MTHADDDFKTLRRYSRQEAAAMLRARDSWLKEWVSKHLVPHQRSGKPGPHQRGVWFTYDDILAIGQLMPSLMSGRQANGRAEGARQAAEADVAEDLGSAESPVVSAVGSHFSDDELEALASLTSLRKV